MPPVTKEDEKASKQKRKDMSSSAGGGTTAKVAKGSLHLEISAMEEREADMRTLDGDAQMYIDTCAEIKRILKEVLLLKHDKGQARAAPEIAGLRTKISLLVLDLKKLNRLEKLRTRKARDATASAKQRVDSFHLQLQNLNYGVLHLQKEIAKCLGFRSKDEDIELVPVQEFYRSAPDSITRPEQTKTDEHQQRLARLEWEHEQRKELSEQKLELEAKRDAAISHISKKEDSLSGLKPQLDTILKTTKPLQDYLNMPLDDRRDQMQMTKYLPNPLYVLYYQACGYADASADKTLKVTIKGDVEDAKLLLDKSIDSTMIGGGVGVGDAPEDEDDGKDDDADEDEKKKKRRTKTAAAKKVDRLFAAHPLAVEITVQMTGDGSGSGVLVTFSYLMRLNVVGAKVKLALGDDSKGLSGEVLQPATLLAHLFPGDDTGAPFSPNPATQHQFKVVGLDEMPKDQLGRLGQTYRWAQALSGLDFPQNESLGGADDDDDDDEAAGSGAVAVPVVVEPKRFKAKMEVGAAAKVESVVQSIRNRLQARIQLQRQLTALEKAKIVTVELPIPKTLLSEFPSRISSRITAWSGIPWEAYQTLEVTKHLVEGEAVNGHDHFFRLQINRSPASLIALVAIKPDYPDTAPIFCLNLHWNGEHNIHNSENLRALEKNVNTCFSHTTGDERRELLALQIQQLMVCLDILLEASCTLDVAANGGKPEFPKEKLFFHGARGRNRSLPLKYTSNPEAFWQR